MICENNMNPNFRSHKAVLGGQPHTHAQPMVAFVLHRQGSMAVTVTT